VYIFEKVSIDIQSDLKNENRVLSGILIESIPVQLRTRK